MNDVIVREAKLDDATGIAKVHVHTWQNAYLGLIPDLYLQGLRVEQRTSAWRKIIENSLPPMHTLVAELEGEIIGFIGIGARQDAGRECQGEVFAIYVRPEIQGRGIGSALMREGLRTLKKENFHSAVLWVLDGNLLTRSWYESRGWKTDGETKIDRREEFELTEIRYQINL